MHTQFGEMDKSELELRVILDYDAPPQAPGVPSISRFVETEWYVRDGPRAGQLARRDVEVQCKPAQLGGQPGRIG